MGADPNAATEEGETALMRAAHKGHIELVKLLVEKGADVDAAEHEEHRTALRETHIEHLDIAKFLIDLTFRVVRCAGWGIFPKYGHWPGACRSL